MPSNFHRTPTVPLNTEAALTRRVDPATGIIIVEGSGMWSNDCSVTHFEEMRNLVGAARQRDRPVRVLVDLCSALVQASNISSYIQQQAESLYRKGDKIAIVVSSRLLAMQMRRVSSRASYKHFENRPDALDWLKSDAAG